MRFFTLIVSALFAAGGVWMISSGKSSGWAVVGFFGLCLLVAIFDPWLPKPKTTCESRPAKAFDTLAVIPPRPADWNKTVEDLVQEMTSGLRKEIRQPEIYWAREYSRSLIPDGLRYPHQGDVYESLVDQPIHYMTAWHAPYTGGGDSTILAGERVWIDSAPIDEKPIGVYARPINYDKMEMRMVPAEERTAPEYNGFYLSIGTMVLLDNFKLVEIGYRHKGEQNVSPDCGGIT